jgi:hypothetical protein
MANYCCVPALRGRAVVGGVNYRGAEPMGYS